ncbi:hypothetical protein N7471_009105 [Penicillium samsonianum]|uniref:uncharacterized protein n=1 Tax=Penicillium samsonianum TaxID=1882272 RepID=UPI00254950A5|nr:uncharacterized protein N7471_009105 [Penicillium samsonianum]KAJ6127888.1 hypothetical protein N7471_009105 [Penicillium samsonianum]
MYCEGTTPGNLSNQWGKWIAMRYVNLWLESQETFVRRFREFPQFMCAVEGNPTCMLFVAFVYAYLNLADGMEKVYFLFLLDQTEAHRELNI